MTIQYKLNKSELTRLKRQYKMYQQFLPVLKLKQEQLQQEQLKAKRTLRKKEAEYLSVKEKFKSLLKVLPDLIPMNIVELAKVRKVIRGEKRVAGIKIPTIKNIEYTKFTPSIFSSPPWLIRGIDNLHILSGLFLEIQIAKEQLTLLTKELKKALQKVNLFEQVLLPNTKYAFGRIQIFLGDEQVAAVGRGKIAKKKNKKMHAELS